jgi:hypothetical protein
MFAVSGLADTAALAAVPPKAPPSRQLDPRILRVILGVSDIY